MKYFIAILALVSMALGIVAFATQQTADDGTSRPKMAPVQGPPDMTKPKEFRLMTRYDLTTALGQLAWQQVATFNAADARADRLKMIQTTIPPRLGYKQMSASSWTITINMVSQKQDGVHVELQIHPILVVDGRTGVLSPGKMIETWVIKNNGKQTECTCRARKFDKAVILRII